MVVIKHPDDRRYSDDPQKAALQRKRAEATYKTYRQAKYVWRQISDDERVWILKHFGYRNPEEANANDKDHDLRELRLHERHLRYIRDYPRTEHRRGIYKAKLAASPPRKDARVRKHERRIREHEQRLRESGL
jgi:hypothetical protein